VIKGEDLTEEDELAKLRHQIIELEKTCSQQRGEFDELQKTKAIFQGLFQHAPDAIIVVNRDGRITQANAQAGKIFGYGENELPDRNVEILIPPRFRESHNEHMKHYISKPRIRLMGSDLELYGLRKDGTEFPVDIALSPLQNKDGISVLSIVRDITEHKRMEEALHASEKKYRGIFENAVEGIFQITPEGKILTVNPSFASMLGYSSPADLISHVSDFRKVFVEPGARLEFMHSLKMTGVIDELEVNIIRKDGSRKWILINARGFGGQGEKPAGFEGMAMDITHRKRAETNFQRLIDSGPDAIVVINNKYEIVLVNALAEKLFGYSMEELPGKHYEILIPERFRKSHTRNCEGYFSIPERRMMGIHLAPVAKHKDGSEFPVEINMSPIETESGFVVVTAIRDITDRKK
jgi:protein-histidine pros-kinase